MYSMIQDIRFALRVLVKSYGVTLIAIVTLALGIGANTAVFSLIDAMLIKPLPYSNPDQLVFVWNTNPNVAFDEITVTIADFIDFKDQNTTFEDMALFQFDNANLTGGGVPAQVNAVLTQPSLFSIHGLPATLGRLIEEGDDGAQRNDVVVLSHTFWQSHYGGRLDIVGDIISINNVPRTVIGVLPHAYEANWKGTDVWLPLVLSPEDISREAHNSRIVARLRDGTSFDAAQADLSSIAVRLAEAYPETNANWGIDLEPYREDVVDPDSQLAFIFLMFAVGFVLLIACTNVANLLMAKASSRRRELAVRAALGAGKWRLVRQLLVESTILALIGGGAGVLLAMWGLDVLVASLPDRVSLQEEIYVSTRSLVFTGLVSLAAALLFGLMPALQSSRIELVETLKDGSQASSASGVRRRARDLLVVGQIAMAMTLVLCTGLMIKSFLHAIQFDSGYDRHGLMTMQLDLPDYAYEDAPQRELFARQVVERLRTQPGVISATSAYDIPVGSFPQANLYVEGHESLDGNTDLWTHFNYVGTDYFETIGVKVIEGRAFNDRDLPDGESVVIVNHLLAERFWPNESALGKRLRIATEENPWATVVGVIPDMVINLFDPVARIEVYRPAAQEPRARLNLIARTNGDPQSLVGAMQSAVWEIDPNVPISDISSIQDAIDNMLGGYRTLVGLLMTLAAIALVLSSVGLYGVIAFTVEMRTQEMGIRMALGARARDVLRLVLSRGVVLTLIGVLVGLVMAAFLGKLLESVMIGVTATDPATYLQLGLLLMAIALLASYIPARRATKIDPMQALRYE